MRTVSLYVAATGGAAIAATLCVAPAAAAPGAWTSFANGARTYAASGGVVRRRLFLCDAVDHAVVLLLAIPAANGRADLLRLAKPSLAATHRTLVVGDPDAGAGQVHYPLASVSGAAAGDVHAVNPGAFDEAVTTAAVVEVTLGGQAASCRFEPRIRFLGATARRTIMVTGPAAGPFRYQSFDYASPVVPLPSSAGGRTQPTLSLGGGHAAPIAGGGRRFDFVTGSYRYRIDARPSGARLTVTRNGHTLLTSAFAGYTIGAATP